MKVDRGSLKVSRASSRSGRGVLTAVLLIACGAANLLTAAEVSFDLPESIECRDVTPPNFAAADYLKVIEGKLRISARVTSGQESEIVDFEYVIHSPDKRIRFQDYLPNTTLESAVADDQIEIKDATEKASTASADVHVVYKILSLGGTLSQSTKDTEANCYRQIAPKELVVASGTTDREHGVFFRLRPSRAASLEGAKEFSFLATVPKDWRGDVCSISCSARVKKNSFWSETIAPSGNRQVEVGLYLSGDVEAASLAEALRRVQEEYQDALAAQPPQPSALDKFSHQAVGLFTSKKPKQTTASQLVEAKRALADVQRRLRSLGR
jgi:hypothetical protein